MADQTKAETIDRLRKWGAVNHDECDSCEYAGFGRPSSHHQMMNPSHRLILVRADGSRSEPIVNVFAGGQQ